MPVDPANTPIFILCGGLGTRLKEETEFRPKPMVPVGDRPILWHIMRSYSGHGFKRFVLCLGYLGDVIQEYFRDSSGSGDWEVTLAETGEAAMTGARVARAAAQHLGDAEHFGVTYGDGLTDADLSAELAIHGDQARIVTILRANPP
jgi:glucose-1-phosphate cytidylyltransferase